MSGKKASFRLFAEGSPKKMRRQQTKIAIEAYSKFHYEQQWFKQKRRNIDWLKQNDFDLNHVMQSTVESEKA